MPGGSSSTTNCYAYAFKMVLTPEMREQAMRTLQQQMGFADPTKWFQSMMLEGLGGQLADRSSAAVWPMAIVNSDTYEPMTTGALYDQLRRLIEAQRPTTEGP